MSEQETVVEKVRDFFGGKRRGRGKKRGDEAPADPGERKDTSAPA